MTVLFLLALLSADAYRDGLAALQRNDVEAAKASLEAAAKVEPGNPRVWLALSRAYQKAGEIPALKQSLARARESLERDDRAEFRHLLAKAYADAGDTTAAAAEFRRAIALNRYEEAYYFDLAQLQLKAQQFAPAIELLESSRSIFARNGQLELALGVAYYGLRRFPEATEAFLRTIALTPEAEQPYVFLSKMLDQTGSRRGDVETRFIALGKANPEDPLAQFLHAQAVAAQNPDLAGRLLRRSIALRESFAEAHFELGVLLERMKLWSEAAREFARAAELKPEDAPTHYRLARAYDRLGEQEKAASERSLHEKLR